jgi:hypothetical protein
MDVERCVLRTTDDIGMLAGKMKMKINVPLALSSARPPSKLSRRDAQHPKEDMASHEDVRSPSNVRWAMPVDCLPGSSKHLLRHGQKEEEAERKEGHAEELERY